MALGEAFINVRGDLRPFARDLDRGIKQILREAEGRLASSGFGRTLGNRLADETQRGIREGTSRGIEDGWDEGTRRGTRRALRSAASFFATLGNFIDDGLSAIPSEIKAGIVVGVAAAAAAVAPGLAATIASAIIAGVGLGVTGAAVIAAARFDVVSRAFTNLGAKLVDQFSAAAIVFIRPLLAAAAKISSFFDSIDGQIQDLFSDAAKLVAPLTEGVIGFVKALLPGIDALTEAALPVVKELSTALPQFGRDLAKSFQIIASTGPEATQAIGDVFRAVGVLILGASALISMLSRLYGSVREVSALVGGPLFAAFVAITRQTGVTGEEAHGMATDFEGVSTALSDTASEAVAARLAIANLAKQLTQGLDATIDYEQAYDDLAKSIKEGNKSFDVGDEKGRVNLRLIKALVDAAARQRDAAIADRARTGESIDEINAKYADQINKINDATGATGRQSTAVQDLLNKALSLPNQVAIDIKTPGLAQAIINMGRLAAAAAALGASEGNAGGGLQSAAQPGSKNKNTLPVRSGTQRPYAWGGIVTTPTNALIGEAGDEVVIPDPAVMPGRAMQLSDAFGLTSLIAKNLGRNSQTVNVYIGSQRLKEIVDYHIGANNRAQAASLSYGPR